MNEHLFQFFRNVIVGLLRFIIKLVVKAVGISHFIVANLLKCAYERGFQRKL